MLEAFWTRAIELVEGGHVPDSVVRWGIRRICSRRLDEGEGWDCEAAAARVASFADDMRHSAIAPVPHRANEQHYEVPAEFFRIVLGPRLKYSCSYFGDDGSSLEAAELEALAQTCERAELEDGQDVLELGCGWGSLTLYMAERYPRSRIVAVSNSAAQRLFIESRAAELGLSNVEVRTADMNAFDPGARFDRVVSIEMFEHMRNYQRLLSRVRRWLQPGGAVFIHIFCHRSWPYEFVSAGADDWMARHFFSGGIMPSDDLLYRFQDDLVVDGHWRWRGTHYQATAEAWLKNLDDELEAATRALSEHPEPELAIRRWRLFFMAVAELFGYAGGQEWWVSHYRLRPRSEP